MRFRFLFGFLLYRWDLTHCCKSIYEVSLINRVVLQLRQFHCFSAVKIRLREFNDSSIISESLRRIKQSLLGKWRSLFLPGTSISLLLFVQLSKLLWFLVSLRSILILYLWKFEADEAISFSNMRALAMFVETNLSFILAFIFIFTPSIIDSSRTFFCRKCNLGLPLALKCLLWIL